MEWQTILIMILVIPIILVVPLLVWAANVSGLYVVVRDRLRRRVAGYRKKKILDAKEMVIR